MAPPCNGTSRKSDEQMEYHFQMTTHVHFGPTPATHQQPSPRSNGEEKGKAKCGRQSTRDVPRDNSDHTTWFKSDESSDDDSPPVGGLPNTQESQTIKKKGGRKGDTFWVWEYFEKVPCPDQVVGKEVHFICSCKVCPLVGKPVIPYQWKKGTGTGTLTRHLDKHELSAENHKSGGGKEKQPTISGYASSMPGGEDESHLLALASISKALSQRTGSIHKAQPESEGDYDCDNQRFSNLSIHTSTTNCVQNNYYYIDNRRTYKIGENSNGLGEQSIGPVIIKDH